jgi:hypothetical protein
MKITSKVLSMASVLTVFLALSTLSGFAQNKHPGYLHALADLRFARAHLETSHDKALGEQEGKAIREIDDALGDIKKAGIDDGKDLNDHPPIDAKLDAPGRRHRALELINKAHSDVSREEDNRFAQGLQQRAMGHIDKAHDHVEEAIQTSEGHRTSSSSAAGMRFQNEGMVLWYGTPDAPAPSGDVAIAPGSQQAMVTVTVALQPPSGSNSVRVRYRVNGGSPLTLSAALQREDLRRKAQYFSVTFPPFQAGDKIEYLAIGSAPGKQVPSAAEATTLPSSFQIATTQR